MGRVPSLLVLAITLGGCVSEYVTDRGAWLAVSKLPKSEQQNIGLVAIRADGQHVLLLPTSVSAVPDQSPRSLQMRLAPRQARALRNAGAILLITGPLAAGALGVPLYLDGDARYQRCLAGLGGSFVLSIVEIFFGAALLGVGSAATFAGLIMTASASLKRATELGQPPPTSPPLPVEPPHPEIPPTPTPSAPERDSDVPHGRSPF